MNHWVMKHQKKKSTTTLEKPTKKLEKESHPEEDNNNNNAEVGDQKQQAGEKQPGEQFGYIFPDQRAVEVVNPTIYDNDENKGEATNKSQPLADNGDWLPENANDSYSDGEKNEEAEGKMRKRKERMRK